MNALAGAPALGLAYAAPGNTAAWGLSYATAGNAAAKAARAARKLRLQEQRSATMAVTPAAAPAAVVQSTPACALPGVARIAAAQTFMQPPGWLSAAPQLYASAAGYGYMGFAHPAPYLMAAPTPRSMVVAPSAAKATKRGGAGTAKTCQTCKLLLRGKSRGVPGTCQC